MQIRFLLTLLLLQIIPSTLLANTKQICDPQVAHLFTYYYESPSPKRIGELIAYVECAGGVPRQYKRTPLTSFFGVIFRQSPESIPIAIDSAKQFGAHWGDIIPNALWFCASQECRETLKRNPYKLPTEELQKLLSEQPPDLSTVAIDSLSTLDLLGGYFIATGDISVVRRILALVLEHWSGLNSNEAVDSNISGVASYGMWWLTSQAAQHERILKLLREQDGSQPAISELIKQAEEKKKRMKT